MQTRTKPEENLSKFDGKRAGTGFISRVDVSYGQSLRTNANFIKHYTLADAGERMKFDV